MSSASRIEYSEKYADDHNEYRFVVRGVGCLFFRHARFLTNTFVIFFCLLLYRHVILPKELAKTLPKSRLLTESEWRGIGVQQSRGWQHYAIHR